MQLLEIRDTAKLIGVSPQWIRIVTDRGELPCLRTSRGIRLFRAADVQRFAEARAAKRAAREVGAEKR